MIKRVWIEDGCTSCGLCENICPEVFTVEDVCKVNEIDFKKFESQIRDSEDSCPVGVIRVD